MKFKKLPKLKKGDKVAILSPSFAAPGKWPHVYQLGLERIREVFELEPVEFPTTSKIGASKEERSKDLIDAFENKEIKAVIAAIGGNDQVTYVKDLPSKPFQNNPKPFFGHSDNTHLHNHLWSLGIPSFYGGSLFTQFAMQGKMDDFTVDYLNKALFEDGEFKLRASKLHNDVEFDWGDETKLNQRRDYEINDGWYWDGNENKTGITWGGCLESIDEMLRHGISLPSLKDFSEIVMILETSEEMPSYDYVFRVLRALGERGVLEKIQGLLFGRPQTWSHENNTNTVERKAYREGQRETVLDVVRQYNKTIPIVQNLDFGHTDPQICMPLGRKVSIGSGRKTIKVEF